MVTQQIARMTYTVKELCVVVGLSRTTVLRQLKKGELPGRQVGRKWIIGRTEIANYLAGKQGR